MNKVFIGFMGWAIVTTASAEIFTVDAHLGDWFSGQTYDSEQRLTPSYDIATKGQGKHSVRLTTKSMMPITIIGEEVKIDFSAEATTK